MTKNPMNEKKKLIAKRAKRKDIIHAINANGPKNNPIQPIMAAPIEAKIPNPVLKTLCFDACLVLPQLVHIGAESLLSIGNL